MTPLQARLRLRLATRQNGDIECACLFDGLRDAPTMAVERATGNITEDYNGTTRLVGGVWTDPVDIRRAMLTAIKDWMRRR
jgi:hypothetical protein